MQQKIKRTGIILVLILLCFTGLFETLYQVTPLPAFEQNAGEYLADVRERATYAYAAARTLNATISLLESVELGAILSLQPGQVLEPINDMIEQFSDLILIALASVGVQEILVRVFGDISWTYLLPLALLPALVAPFSNQWERKLNRFSAALVIGVIATRLLIPTIAFGGHLITETYLRGDFDTALQQVETVREETSKALNSSQKFSQQLPPKISAPRESSIFSQAPRDKDSTPLIPDWETVRKLADSDQIIAMLDNVPERIITLITIFVFETIVLPLLMIFFFLWTGRRIISIFQ